MKYLVTYTRVITEVIEAEDAAQAKRRADGLPYFPTNQATTWRRD